MTLHLPAPQPPANATTPIVDPLLDDMVKSMAGDLNRAYPGHTIVRTTRTYDAYLVPLTEFPLLKIFRLNDTFQQVELAASTVTAAYCLVNADIERMPGLTKWVGDRIVRAIHRFGIEKRSYRLVGEISIRYRTLAQQGELIYQTQADFQLEA